MGKRCCVTGRVVSTEPPGKWRRFGSLQGISIRWAEAKTRLASRLDELQKELKRRKEGGGSAAADDR